MLPLLQHLGLSAWGRRTVLIRPVERESLVNAGICVIRRIMGNEVRTFLRRSKAAGASLCGVLSGWMTLHMYTEISE